MISVTEMELHYQVWDVISMTWTEIGLVDSDYPALAKSIKHIEPDWNKVNHIILYDVCASFAIDTILIFPFWMLMPDWGYDEDYLKQRITKWHTKPKWFWFLNPIRIIGYPLSLLMSYGVRHKLKRAYINC